MVLKGIHDCVNLQEDFCVLKRYAFLVLCYPKISIKALANRLFLPVPIVSAIKNEMKKKSMVTDISGITLTSKGELIVRMELQIKDLDISRFLQLASMTNCHELFPEAHDIFEKRPEADVTLDQSKCTIETSFKRAHYLITHQQVVSGSLLCVGDDDLVSVAYGFLYRYLTHQKGRDFKVTVVDKDFRVLDYIHNLSSIHQLPIDIVFHDLKDPMPKSMNKKYDVMITDPPYTMSGLELFILRGISCLKRGREVAIYLSFPVKPPEIRLAVQAFFTSQNILIDQIIDNFNRYEGAQIIGGVSNFFSLKTTVDDNFESLNPFTGKLYTREQNPKIRNFSR